MYWYAFNTDLIILFEKSKNIPGMWISLYLTETVWTPNSLGTKWTAYRPSSTSLISASSVTPPGEVTVAVRSKAVIPVQSIKFK